jgi:hypothetical protein
MNAPATLGGPAVTHLTLAVVPTRLPQSFPVTGFKKNEAQRERAAAESPLRGAGVKG